MVRGAAVPAGVDRGARALSYSPRMSRVALLALLVACGGAKAPPPKAPVANVAPVTAKVLVSVNSQGVGLGGHDPVSYIETGPQVGLAEHAVEHGGATYWLVNAQNEQFFRERTEAFAPAFGGYCAFAAAEARLSEADPTVYAVVQDRLLVFTNPEFFEQFMADPDGNLARADANWPTLVEKYGK